MRGSSGAGEGVYLCGRGEGVKRVEGREGKGVRARGGSAVCRVK